MILFECLVFSKDCFDFFQDLNIPKHVMEVIDEELNKLSFLDNHSSEFKWVYLLLYADKEGH